jgi:hypothetical protein
MGPEYCLGTFTETSRKILDAPNKRYKSHSRVPRFEVDSFSRFLNEWGLCPEIGTWL